MIVRKITFIFLTYFCFSFQNVTSDNKILVTVFFENTSNKQMNYGKFIAPKLNKIIEVTSEKSFNFYVPNKGRYSFFFESTNFKGNIISPKKITKNSNTITIRLIPNSDLYSEIHFLKMTYEQGLSDVDLLARIASQNAKFIFNGIQFQIPKEFSDKLMKKYGVGVLSENCVIDPITAKNSRENNQILLNYLKKKHPNIEKELIIKPFGI